MSGLGFNKSTVRNLNRAQFFISKKSSSSGNKDMSNFNFSLFLRSGVSFNIESRVDVSGFTDRIDKWSDQLTMISGVSSMLGGAFESIKAPLSSLSGLGRLSFSSKGSYKGTSPISFSLDGILAPWSGNGYENDVITPLKNLLLCTVPIRNSLMGDAKTLIDDLNKTANDAVESNLKSSYKDTADQLKKLIDGLADAAKSYLGDLYMVTTPPAFLRDYIVSVKIGNLNFTDIIITNVTYSFPSLISYDKNPEYIGIKLDCSSTRPADMELFQSFVGSVDESTIKSLNSL